MTKEDKRPYAVRVALIQGNKFLFARHNNPEICEKWTFPGGRLNPDDADSVAALRREMREELSIEIEITQKIGTVQYPSGVDYAIYAATPLGYIGMPKPEEILEIRWITLTEVYFLHINQALVFGFELWAILSYLEKH